MIILIVTATYNSYKGNTDAKIFMAGFAVLQVFLSLKCLYFYFILITIDFHFFNGVYLFLYFPDNYSSEKITSLHNKQFFIQRLEKKNAQLDLMNEVKVQRQTGRIK